jgi:hypothetical protein
MKYYKIVADQVHLNPMTSYSFGLENRNFGKPDLQLIMNYYQIAAELGLNVAKSNFAGIGQIITQKSTNL